MSQTIDEQHPKTNLMRLAFSLYYDTTGGRSTEDWWRIREEARADFDGWFNEIRADAWDEGKEYAMRGLDIHGDTNAENPYREAPNE